MSFCCCLVVSHYLYIIIYMIKFSHNLDLRIILDDIMKSWVRSKETIGSKKSSLNLNLQNARRNKLYIIVV